MGKRMCLEPGGQAGATVNPMLHTGLERHGHSSEPQGISGNLRQPLKEVT